MPKVLFLHIPKNAGTTIHSVLERNFSPFRSFSIHTPRERSLEILKKVPERTRSKWSCVKGHFPFGLHRDFGEDWNYFTFLREPLRRTKSHFRYVQGTPTTVGHERISRGAVGFPEAVESGFINDNFQVRWLVEGGLALPPNGVRESHFEEALGNLERLFPVVGLVEHFDRSLQMLGAVYGLQSIKYVSKNLTGERVRHEFLPEWEEALAESNKWDLRLYQWACDRFEKHWQKSIDAGVVDGTTSSLAEKGAGAGFLKVYDRVRYIYCRIVWKALGTW